MKSLFISKGVYNQFEWIGISLVLMLTQYTLLLVFMPLYFQIPVEEGYIGAASVTPFNFKYLVFMIREALLERNVFAISITIAITVIMLTVGYMNIIASVKRLHDTGRSGLWMLWHFVPILGSFIVFIVSLFFKSVKIDNPYREDVDVYNKVVLPPLVIIGLFLLVIYGFYLIKYKLFVGYAYNPSIYLNSTEPFITFIPLFIIFIIYYILFISFDWSKYFNITISFKQKLLTIMALALLLLILTGGFIIHIYPEEDWLKFNSHSFVLRAQHFFGLFGAFFILIGSINTKD